LIHVRFFGRFGRAGLASCDEASTDPDGTGTEHQCGSDTAAVADSASGDELNRLLCEGRRVSLADIGAGGNKDAVDAVN